MTLAGPTETPPATSSEKPKRKRGRKPKQPEAPTPPPGQPTPEDLDRCKLALKTTFEIASKVAAKKWGEQAGTSEEENDKLAEVWTAALAPYLGDIGAVMPWATALVVTGIVVYPKYEAVKAAGTPPAETPGPRLEV